jgi:non-specific serine/threonine protein kinase
LQWQLGNKISAEAHALEDEQLCLLLGPEGKVDLAHARIRLNLFRRGITFAEESIQVRRRFDEVLKLLQEAGNQWQMASWISRMGLGLMHSGDFTGARQTLEQSLRLFRECGDMISASQANRLLAQLTLEEGNYAEACASLEEILHFYRQARINIWIDIPLWLLGVIAVREGNYARAKAWYTECLLFDRQIGLTRQLAECLIGFAGIASAEKRFERAAQLLSAAEAEMEGRRTPLENIDRIEFQRLTTLLRKELGDARFEALAAQGRLMAREQVIAYTLEEQGD